MTNAKVVNISHVVLSNPEVHPDKHKIATSIASGASYASKHAALAQVIAAESEEADKVKSVVSQEEAVASKEAAGVKAIKVRIQDRL